MEKLYIYGKLNKEEIIKQYTAGLGDGTANTIIDNQNNKISVQVVRVPNKLTIRDAEKVFGSFDGENEVIIDLSEYATDEDLSQLSNKVNTFDSRINNINSIANTELFAYVDTDSTIADKIVLRFKNKNNTVLATSTIKFPDQIQADWIQADSTKPSYIKNKPTKLSQFTNDGDGKGSPFITVADVDAKVDEKLKIIKTDGQGNKYLADDGEYKDIVTNRSLNPAWKIDGTTQEFINSILADSTAVVGTSYLGGVKFTDLPTPLNNAECLVEILSSTLGSDIKVIHLDLYSATTSPYHWSTIYYTQLPDPIWQPDVIQADVDAKLDKTGGTISGNLNIAGNLEVAGTTITKDAETLLIKDNVIVTNSDKQTLLNLSGLAINKNGNETYGIMYDPTSDSVKLGLGSLDENNKFTFSESGNPVAVRSDSSLLVDGHLIKWDANNYCFVDSGKSVDDFVLKGEIKQDYQIVKEEPADKSQGKMIYENVSSPIVPKYDPAGTEHVYGAPQNLVDKYLNDSKNWTWDDVRNLEWLGMTEDASTNQWGYVIPIDESIYDVLYSNANNPLKLKIKIHGLEQELSAAFDSISQESGATWGHFDERGLFYFTIQTLPSPVLYDSISSGEIPHIPCITYGGKYTNVEILSISSQDGTEIWKNVGKSSVFNIANLKIADGTKYNALKNLVNAGMQEKLTAGTGITIENNIISATAQDIRTDNQTITLNANQEIQAVGVYNTSTNNVLSSNDLWLASSIKRRKK